MVETDNILRQPCAVLYLKSGDAVPIAFHPTTLIHVVSYTLVHFVLPSRQIDNRRDKFIQSVSLRTNFLTFVNM